MMFKEYFNIMKLYKRNDIIEFESQTQEESDQLNFLFLLLSKESVKWDIFLRDGKYILGLKTTEGNVK